MATALLEQPVNAEPSKPPRKRGTFTAETGRKAALASVQARAAKAQRLAEPDSTAPLPLAADVPVGPGAVLTILPRERSELAAHDERVRLGLARVLAKQVEVFEQNPPTKRADLTGRDGMAQATKTLSDAAGNVFGWGDTQPGGLIVVGEITAMGEPVQPQPAQVTDCQTVPAAGQPVIDGAPVAEGLPVPEAKPSLGAGPVGGGPGASC